jgi:hypothetical protein
MNDLEDKRDGAYDLVKKARPKGPLEVAKRSRPGPPDSDLYTQKDGSGC